LLSSQPSFGESANGGGSGIVSAEFIKPSASRLRESARLAD
jgi:hypothetical protein